MSLKKNFITVGIVLVVAVLVILLYASSKKESSVSQDPVQNQGSVVPASLLS
jgi:hypothetical protein